MNERGLWLDLDRIVHESLERAMKVGHSWTLNHVFITSKQHRLHTVCSTLESLGYVSRRWDVGELPGAESAWELTEQGVELWNELGAQRHRWPPD